MRRLKLLAMTAIATALLSGCLVTDRTTGKPRPKTEKAPRKAAKGKKHGKKKTTPPPTKPDGRTGASRRM